MKKPKITKCQQKGLTKKGFKFKPVYLVDYPSNCKIYNSKQLAENAVNKFVEIKSKIKKAILNSNNIDTLKTLLIEERVNENYIKHKTLIRILNKK